MLTRGRESALRAETRLPDFFLVLCATQGRDGLWFPMSEPAQATPAGNSDAVLVNAGPLRRRGALVDEGLLLDQVVNETVRLRTDYGVLWIPNYGESSNSTRGQGIWFGLVGKLCPYCLHYPEAAKAPWKAELIGRVSRHNRFLITLKLNHVRHDININTQN